MQYFKHLLLNQNATMKLRQAVRVIVETIKQITPINYTAHLDRSLVHSGLVFLDKLNTLLTTPVGNCSNLTFFGPWEKAGQKENMQTRTPWPNRE